jgi:hypothetical protein
MPPEFNLVRDSIGQDNPSILAGTQENQSEVCSPSQSCQKTSIKLSEFKKKTPIPH